MIIRSNSAKKVTKGGSNAQKGMIFARNFGKELLPLQNKNQDAMPTSSQGDITGSVLAPGFGVSDSIWRFINHVAKLNSTLTAESVRKISPSSINSLPIEPRLKRNSRLRLNGNDSIID